MCTFIIIFHCYRIVLKSKSLLLFKLNQLMVTIGKKPAPGDHKSSLKSFLARCLCAKYILLQSAKILLLPPKIRNNYAAIKSLIFFLLFLVKLSLLILFSSFLVSVFYFFFYRFLSKVIALPTIAIAIVVALSRS